MPLKQFVNQVGNVKTDSTATLESKDGSARMTWSDAGASLERNATKLDIDANDQVGILGVPDAANDAGSGVAIGRVYYNTTVNAYTKRIV